MSQLLLDTVHKSYGEVHAVKGVSLDIPEGEFVVLVGPSGCGKSTLLRAIAGLEDISSGTIRLGSRDITHAQPRARNIAMVFQSYALYPYLSVYENIAFGLRARKTPQAEIDSRVQWAADILDITDYLQRFPRELSGGQRQRVAIGRAIVREAELYLFDEPLSNLDAKLRDGMREEIKRLHRRIGKTFVYVTHDQIEAMTLAERIVLLRDGVIAQQGAPLDLFERPGNTFVAGFLGSPAMNMITATVSADGTRLDLTDGQSIALSGDQVALGLATNQRLLWGVRPEQFRVARRGPNALKATVDIVQPTGSRSFASFMIGEDHVVAELDAHHVTKANQTLTLAAAMERTVLFDPQTGGAIGDNR